MIQRFKNISYMKIWTFLGQCFIRYTHLLSKNEEKPCLSKSRSPRLNSTFSYISMSVVNFQEDQERKKKYTTTASRKGGITFVSKIGTPS